MKVIVRRDYCYPPKEHMIDERPHEGQIEGLDVSGVVKLVVRMVNEGLQAHRNEPIRLSDLKFVAETVDFDNAVAVAMEWTEVASDE